MSPPLLFLLLLLLPLLAAVLPQALAAAASDVSVKLFMDGAAMVAESEGMSVFQPTPTKAGQVIWPTNPWERSM